MDYYFGLLFPIVATIHIAGKAGFQLGKAVIVAGCGHLTPQARKVAKHMRLVAASGPLRLNFLVPAPGQRATDPIQHAAPGLMHSGAAVRALRARRYGI